MKFLLTPLGNENTVPPNFPPYIGMAVAALSRRAAPFALPLFRPNRRQGYRQGITWRFFQEIEAEVKNLIAAMGEKNGAGSYGRMGKDGINVLGEVVK